MKKFIIFIVLLSSGCALYSEEMRGKNELWFTFQCKQAYPSASPQELQICIDRKHMAQEKFRRDKFGRIINKLNEGMQESLKDQPETYQKQIDKNPTIHCDSNTSDCSQH